MGWGWESCGSWLGRCAALIPAPMDAIQASHLTKRYGEVLAVDDISFIARAGATVGLLGGNGAGKTTTIAMLLGLLVPSAGSITVLGHDIARDRFAALARMNFSSPYLSLPQRLTVAENLGSMATFITCPGWSGASPSWRTSWSCAIC
jgi:ABC-2 type transport system ATP-binding protein